MRSLNTCPEDSSFTHIYGFADFACIQVCGFTDFSRFSDLTTDFEEDHF